MRGHEAITALGLPGAPFSLSAGSSWVCVCEFGPTPVVVSSPGWSLSPGWDPHGWMAELSWLHCASLSPLLKPDSFHPGRFQRGRKEPKREGIWQLCPLLSGLAELSSRPGLSQPSLDAVGWGLPVASGVLRLSLPLPAGFGVVPSWALYTKGRRRAREPSVPSRTGLWHCPQWVGCWVALVASVAQTPGCHRHWCVVEFLSSSSSSQDPPPHPLPIPSVLMA